MAAYGLGMTDKFKGTGVWSGVQFEREGGATAGDGAAGASAAEPNKVPSDDKSGKKEPVGSSSAK